MAQNLRFGYKPPPEEAIVETNLGDPIRGVRSVLPSQQERFGFRYEGLNLHLWCAGEFGLVRESCVAIVATLNFSLAGVNRATRLARELFEAGVVVASGLPKGVDTEALTSATEAGGQVVAVIGTPLQTAYPAENKRQQETIYSDHLLVSQFAPRSTSFSEGNPARKLVDAGAGQGASGGSRPIYP